MSTYNFQFELEDRSYAVTVTPFDQEGIMCYRVAYNDSSSLVFCPSSVSNEYDISGTGSEELPDNLKERLLHCISTVEEKELNGGADNQDNTTTQQPS